MEETAILAYVEAAGALLGIPLDAERLAAVSLVMARLAAFAADVALAVPAE
jgi:hypothetical protein